MPELPSLDTVREWATTETANDEASMHVLVTPRFERRPGEVRRSSVDGESAYVGNAPASVGLLAAAAAATRDAPGARLHYPDVDRTVPGPWLVLEPLDGALGTVSTGRALARITLSRDAGSNVDRLVTDRGRLETVLEAARPTHEHYPVDADEDGVFTTGMSTYELSEVTAGEELTVCFEVSTTPETTFAAVRDRFASEEGVLDVEVEPVAGVERADPDGDLRRLLEATSDAVLGEYRYEWLSEGAEGFAQLPTCNKIAFGTGRRGEPFTGAAYDAARAVVEQTITRREGSR